MLLDEEDLREKIKHRILSGMARKQTADAMAQVIIDTIKDAGWSGELETGGVITPETYQ